MLGGQAIIGGSADDLEQALGVQAAGADYVGLGPIFTTTSKDDAGPVTGLQNLANVCKNLNIPVVAIGGVGQANAAEVMAAGAYGIAVISAVCCQESPVQAAADLIKAMNI